MQGQFYRRGMKLLNAEEMEVPNCAEHMHSIFSPLSTQIKFYQTYLSLLCKSHHFRIKPFQHMKTRYEQLLTDIKKITICNLSKVLSPFNSFVPITTELHEPDLRTYFILKFISCVNSIFILLHLFCVGFFSFLYFFSTWHVSLLLTTFVLFHLILHFLTFCRSCFCCCHCLLSCWCLTFPLIWDEQRKMNYVRCWTYAYNKHPTFRRCHGSICYAIFLWLV